MLRGFYGVCCAGHMYLYDCQSGRSFVKFGLLTKLTLPFKKIFNVCTFLPVQQCAVKCAFSRELIIRVTTFVSKLHNLEGKGAMVSPDLVQN